MMAATIVLSFIAWMVLGSIVVETCRIWRSWWLDPTDLLTAALWPVVLILTIANGDPQ